MRTRRPHDLDEFVRVVAEAARARRIRIAKEIIFCTLRIVFVVGICFAIIWLTTLYQICVTP